MTPAFTDRITLIPGFNPGPYTGDGNNTYLLLGAEPTLIDAGVGHARHLDALDAALDADGADLVRVVVTHGHMDHASGAEAIARRWPRAVFSKMPWPERDARYGVDWVPLADGAQVRAGDAVLRAIHTPGHAPDHLCFLHEESRTLLCGDLVIQGGTVVVPSGRHGSLRAYLASLQRVLELRPATLLPAHGPTVDDPAALIQHYFDHRRRREEQIVAALGDGCRTPHAIAERIYHGLASDLRGAAVDNVRANLEKLREERRAVETPNAEWELA